MTQNIQGKDFVNYTLSQYFIYLILLKMHWISLNWVSTPLLLAVAEEFPYSLEPCPGLVDYVMIWIKEPFIKNEKSTIDVLIS